jgi:hypothetical protein
MEDNEALNCPITGDVMEDPLIFPDGYTYEKSAIETWLRSHSQSPFTRQRMTMDQGMPNRAIRTMIEEAKAGGNANMPKASAPKPEIAKML